MKKKPQANCLKRWMQGLGLTYVLLLAAGMLQYEMKSEPVFLSERIPVNSAETDVKPRVAITFDDGPDIRTTPILLDGLKQRGVRATFFVIGANVNKEGNGEIIKRMYQEGHLIGNHTYHHVDLSGLNRDQAFHELKMTEDLVEELTGQQTNFVRPPFGSFPDDMEDEVSKFYVKWTVDPLDWTTKNADEIVERVVSDTEEGDIILLHDCYESSVRAALRIIDILEMKGYEFVTVDQLLIE